jgi:hypothetical protein
MKNAWTNQKKSAVSHAIFAYRIEGRASLLLPYGSFISVHFTPESTTGKLDQIRLMLPQGKVRLFPCGWFSFA